MVQADILIETEAGRTRDVVEAIRAIPGAARVDSAEAEDTDDLGRMIINQIQPVPGIARTVTCSVVHL